MEIINWDEFLMPYEQIVSELTLKLENLAGQYRKSNKHCPIEQVEGRVKSVGSILQKANKKNIPLSELADKMEDIAGIRVICRFVEDIERVVDLIKQRDGFDMQVLQERDYITNIKPSGYRSYHLIMAYPVMTCHGYKDMKAEIQIRTMSMNFWATIEHSLKYKYNSNIPEEVQRRLISSAEAAFQLDREMSTIRDEITEAQKVIQVRNDTVSEIIDNIKNLHTVAKIDEMNELNKEFIELYQEDNLEKLLSFAEQLRIMTDIYKVRFSN